MWTKGCSRSSLNWQSEENKKNITRKAWSGRISNSSITKSCANSLKAATLLVSSVSLMTCAAVCMPQIKTQPIRNSLKNWLPLWTMSISPLLPLSCRFVFNSFTFVKINSNLNLIYYTVHCKTLCRWCDLWCAQLPFQEQGYPLHWSGALHAGTQNFSLLRMRGY